MIRYVLVCALCASAFAAADEPSQQFESVIVTATRSEQPQNRLPAAMTVITRTDIERSGAHTLAEALRGVAGVQISGDFYGDGSSAVIDMRGFGVGANATTLVLVDGRRLNNPDIAPPDLASISLESVERIEIIQGSAGTLYGDQAVGGVVNIVTRQAAKLAGDVRLEGGSYSGQRASGSIGQRVGGFFYRISGEASGSDNYRRHNHHENENALGRAGYDYVSGAAYLEAGYINDRVQTPGGLTAEKVEEDRRDCSHCDDYADVQTTLQRLNWRQTLNSGWEFETDFTHRRSDGNVQLTFGETASTLVQNRNLWSLNPRATGKFRMAAGEALVTVGADGQLAEYELISAIGPQTDTQRTRDFYAQAVLPIVSSLEGTIGCRLARVDNELFDGFTFPTPTSVSDSQHALEAGVAWRAIEHLRLFARYDGNYRFAKADEFYSLGPPPSGAPLLQTQTGGTYEIGADWKTEPIELHASLYKLELKNEISFDPNTFSNFNLPRTRRDGVVLQADWRALDLLTLSAGGQYVRAVLTGGSNSGRDVPLVARETGRVAATVTLAKNVSTYVELIATGHRPYDSDFANSAGELPGVAVVNVAANGSYGPWRASARVNNLADRKYSEYGVLTFAGPAFYPSPGVNFWLSLGYAF
ncbi:MAG TPA: TonB-dependent receptor [Nevskiaceae bacterium]|nr:TonB-dependent receptor [Nevskiaceae bacterium]